MRSYLYWEGVGNFLTGCYLSTLSLLTYVLAQLLVSIVNGGRL